MFEIMYLIFFAFVIVIAVAVSIYEIKARRNAENAFWRECEESTAAKEAADRLEGEKLSLKEQYNLLHNKNSQLVIDKAVLQTQNGKVVGERRLIEEKYEKLSIRCEELSNGKEFSRLRDANRQLLERNFDDMMSLFECTIGEGGKEYYEKDGICLIVENGKCIGYYRPHGADACEGEERADEAEECPSSTADAVEVVRCEECRHCESYYPTKAKGEEYYPPQHRCMMLNRVVRPEHFCSYGERKASEDA